SPRATRRRHAAHAENRHADARGHSGHRRAAADERVRERMAALPRPHAHGDRVLWWHGSARAHRRRRGVARGSAGRARLRAARRSRAPRATEERRRRPGARIAGADGAPDGGSRPDVRGYRHLSSRRPRCILGRGGRAAGGSRDAGGRRCAPRHAGRAQRGDLVRRRRGQRRGGPRRAWQAQRGRRNLGMWLRESDGTHAVHGARLLGAAVRTTGPAVPSPAAVRVAARGPLPRSRFVRGRLPRPSDAWILRAVPPALGGPVLPVAMDAAGYAARLPRVRSRRAPRRAGVVVGRVMGRSMSAALVLVALGLIAASGVPGLFFGRQSPVGERVAAVLLVVGSVLGLLVTMSAMAQPVSLLRAWSVPGGEFAVRVDGLAAMFLLPLFVVAPLGSIYGLEYWPQRDHADDGRKLRLFYGLQAAGIGLLLVAANAVLFLVGWETMALAAFFCITTEDRDEAVRQTGYVYLVATRIGTLL